MKLIYDLHKNAHKCKKNPQKPKTWTFDVLKVHLKPKKPSFFETIVQTPKYGF